MYKIPFVFNEILFAFDLGFLIGFIFMQSLRVVCSFCAKNEFYFSSRFYKF